jgi:hypothetical protein
LFQYDCAPDATSKKRLALEKGTLLKTRYFILTAVALAVLTGSGKAGIYTFNTGLPNGGIIPDANSTGWSDTRSVSYYAGSGEMFISSVTVNLNLSGGFNGDLYAYLSYTPSVGSGSGFAVLLNRIGSSLSNPFGYSDSGFNVTLSDSASTDIHTYGGGPLTQSSYLPDGRNVNPAVTFDPGTTPRTATMTSFNNLDPNGTWTLFFADMSSGGQTTVSGWSLIITAIPEPVNVALGLLAGGFIVLRTGRLLRRKGGV